MTSTFSHLLKTDLKAAEKHYILSLRSTPKRSNLPLPFYTLALNLYSTLRKPTGVMAVHDTVVRSGIELDGKYWSTLIKSTDLKSSRMLFEKVRKSSTYNGDSRAFIDGAFLSALSKAGLVEEMISFKDAKDEEVVGDGGGSSGVDSELRFYNLLLKGLNIQLKRRKRIKGGPIEVEAEVMTVLDRMKSEGVAMDEFSYGSALQALSLSDDSTALLKLYQKMKLNKRLNRPNKILKQALIIGLGRDQSKKEGGLEAVKIFETIKNKDVKLFNAVMKANYGGEKIWEREAKQC